MKPKDILSRFDTYLASVQFSFEAVVVGGTALSLLGIIHRETRDCDVLDPQISKALRTAATDFARQMRSEGIDLDDDWLNDAPLSLSDSLPKEWKRTLQVVFQGSAITLHTLGRRELLMSKLFALCDRALDRPDCLALAPTTHELEELAPWLKDRDTNPDWPTHVENTLVDLGQRLGHGV